MGGGDKPFLFSREIKSKRVRKVRDNIPMKQREKGGGGGGGE